MEKIPTEENSQQKDPWVRWYEACFGNGEISVAKIQKALQSKVGVGVNLWRTLKVKLKTLTSFSVQRNDSSSLPLPQVRFAQCINVHIQNPLFIVMEKSGLLSSFVRHQSKKENALVVVSAQQRQCGKAVRCCSRNPETRV